MYTTREDAKNSLTPETALEGAAADSWLTDDPRVQWLIDKSQSLKHEKILIIASQAATVLKLEQHFRDAHGIHVAVFS